MTTDKIKGLTVVLDDDYEEDELDSIIKAIKMVKGVLDVKKENINKTDFMNRRRIEMKMKEKILGVLD